MILDLIIGLLLAIAFYHGWQKGLISSMLAVFAIGLSLMAAVKLSGLASVFILEKTALESKYVPIVAFIAVLIAALLFFRMLGGIVTGLVKAVQLGWANRLSGAVLWTAIASLVLSAGVWYVDRMDFIPEGQKEQSATFPILHDFAPVVIEGVGNILPMMRDSYDTLDRFFDDLADEATEYYEQRNGESSAGDDQ